METTIAGAIGHRASAPSPAAQRARRDRWFFSGTAVLQVVLILWGFAPSYYLRAIELPALSPLLRVHGALFTAWLVLLLVQTTFVATRRTPLHRRLGSAGGVLAAVMVVVGCVAGIDAARRGSALPGMSPEAFMIIPVLGILAFGALVAAAIALRRRPDAHKRLMMLATAGALVGAGVARIPAIAPLGPLGFLGIPDLFAVGLILYDLATSRRVHPATAAGTLFILAVQGTQLTMANSGPWLAVAGWLIG